MGLITDPYNFANGAVADADQVDARFAPLYNLVNGQLDGDNLTDALATLLGIPQTGEVRRGKSIIATEGTRTNVAYGALSDGPDRVSSVVLPTDGLLIVAFSAEIKSSVSNAGRAAIFLGANQLKDRAGTVQEASTSGLSYCQLGAFPGGLTLSNTVPAEVTTGQVVGVDGANPVGGFAVIRAAAGTYDVSVQTKSSSGSVTMKNRRLWVEARGY